MPTTLNAADWERGKAHELHYWRSFLKRRGHWYKVSRPLRREITELISERRTARIADCGAGPVSLIGNAVKGKQIQVTACDVLADEYADLCEELGVRRYIPVEKQDITCLGYDHDSFDVVWCSNAVDHCLDPWAAVQEMVRICRPGGWVYLRHVAHEARRMSYSGLHTWNLDVVDADCLFWTKAHAQSFMLSACHAGFESWQTSERYPLVICALQKEQD
jgi:SAM-dependent methyltransferase